MMMFGRAFSHQSEIERASRCRGTDMLYGGYHVVHEVEAAPQKPLWGQEACKYFGRCSGAGVEIQALYSAQNSLAHLVGMTVSLVSTARERKT